MRKIGIRVALGSSPRAVLSSILGRGLLLAGLGIAAGIPAAVALTRFTESVLFDIPPSDPMTFLQAAGVMLAAAFLASWIPVRRALAIDPATALCSD